MSTLRIKERMNFILLAIIYMASNENYLCIIKKITFHAQFFNLFFNIFIQTIILVL